MRRSIITIVTLTAILMTNSSFAHCPVTKHTEIPVITGLTYHDARVSLLKAGWQPVNNSYLNDVEDPDTRYGNSALFLNKGYIELESCAGTGLAPCLFDFADVYGNRLKVVTGGEESPKQNIYASIDRYWLACEEL